MQSLYSGIFISKMVRQDHELSVDCGQDIQEKIQILLDVWPFQMVLMPQCCGLQGGRGPLHSLRHCLRAAKRRASRRHQGLGNERPSRDYMLIDIAGGVLRRFSGFHERFKTCLSTPVCASPILTMRIERTCRRMTAAPLQQSQNVCLTRMMGVF